MPALITAGVATIGLITLAGATLAGAALARRQAARRELCFGATAGALLVITGAHLLPDAWTGARDAGLPAWSVMSIAVLMFCLARPVIRRGCTCPSERAAAGGAATAAALVTHRALEGAAFALTGSVSVLGALAVHALAEGLAAGTMLGSGSRCRAALWLTAMCASPVAGTAVAATAIAGSGPIPQPAAPILTAAAVGVLGQAAWVSVVAAFGQVRPVPRAGPAVALLAAGLVTALAVHGAG
jgi:zinc transporter ZupT